MKTEQQDQQCGTAKEAAKRREKREPELKEKILMQVPVRTCTENKNMATYMHVIPNFTY